MSKKLVTLFLWREVITKCDSDTVMNFIYALMLLLKLLVFM